MIALLVVGIVAACIWWRILRDEHLARVTRPRHPSQPESRPVYYRCRLCGADSFTTAARIAISIHAPSGEWAAVTRCSACREQVATAVTPVQLEELVEAGARVALDSAQIWAGIEDAS